MWRGDGVVIDIICDGRGSRGDGDSGEWDGMNADVWLREAIDSISMGQDIKYFMVCCDREEY